VEQAALADFMEAGHFERHVRRMRALYAERQAALVGACRRELGGLLDVQPADAGMHLAGRLPAGSDDAACSAAAQEAGIEATALSRYCVEPPVTPVLLLGYTVVPAEDALPAVRTLAGALGIALKQPTG
jgi:GntR family transcriptional regulator/MocR family aminotransferase